MALTEHGWSVRIQNTFDDGISEFQVLDRTVSLFFPGLRRPSPSPFAGRGTRRVERPSSSLVLRCCAFDVELFRADPHHAMFRIAQMRIVLKDAVRPVAGIAQRFVVGEPGNSQL